MLTLEVTAADYMLALQKCNCMFNHLVIKSLYWAKS